jgi:ABC-type cobalamin/Fe3+-siderophores transport system ATPase subunit
MFSKNIGDIFFSYAQKLNEQKVKCYDNKTELDANFLTSEPWTTLNELFNDLKFEYNFKKDYKIINAEIDTQPQLYPALKNGDIDESNPRQLSDLSDGEKAILSLSFASLNNDKMEGTVLLLDEYDATLNPSLIKMFFAVIEKFFIKKNILVIIVTHSTATLSLAPDYATFYEIFKPNDTEKRILPVKREDYRELRTANENFYKIIDNHETRTKEILEDYAKLESQNKSLQEKIIKSLKPIIITEGKTDVCHLEAALKTLKITDIDFEFADMNAVECGDSELKKCLESLTKLPNNQRIIGIFDRDVSDIVKGIESNGQKYKSYGNNVYAFCIPVPSHRTDYSNISIEFYYTDNELKKEHNKKCLYFDNEVDEIRNNSTKETTLQLASPIREHKELSKKIYDKDIGSCDFIHSKTKFAELIEADEEFVKGVKFNEFHLIFETIKEILSL